MPRTDVFKFLRSRRFECFKIFHFEKYREATTQENTPTIFFLLDRIKQKPNRIAYYWVFYLDKCPLYFKTENTILESAYTRCVCFLKSSGFA